MKPGGSVARGCCTGTRAAPVGPMRVSSKEGREGWEVAGEGGVGCFCSFFGLHVAHPRGCNGRLVGAIA